MQPDYAFYPSLLQKFQDLLDYEQVAEEDWNKDAEGDYRLTPDEMYLKLEADLIDTINRVPHAPSEAADKGTAFNEIVDCLIESRKPNPPVELKSYVAEDGEKRIRADINGFMFDFPCELCKDVASRFPGSLTQYFADAVMEMPWGARVRLYGYIDEWVGNRIVDLKTTSRYSWGKFEKGWQRHVYPWCVIEMGVATEIESFTYFVIEWAYQAKNAPVTAKGLYEETYDYDHEESGRKIREMCGSFIGWLESRREWITDRRVFGGENPEGYEGKPVDRAKLEEFLFNPR